MDLNEARRTLANGAAFTTLAEAIGVIISDPSSSVEDILLGFQHQGLIAEQAALALYQRTGRPLPQDRSQLVEDPDEWRRWIAEAASRRVYV